MYCDLDHASLYYEVIGEGRPVLMLHGFYPDHRLMKGCMEPLFDGRAAHRPGWRRIYFDLPGMGRTRGEPWIENSDQVLDLVLQFIDQVIPEPTCLLAGESYGGYLARGIMTKRPALAGGLLLICPLLVAEDRSLPPFRVLRSDPELIAGLSPHEQAEFAGMAVVQSPPVWARFRDEILAGLDVADAPFLERLRNHGYAFSFDPDAPARPFDLPTLILLGRQDASVGYRDAWRIIENYARATFAVLDMAGHNLQIEQVELFNALVGEWLDRVATHP